MAKWTSIDGVQRWTGDQSPEQVGDYYDVQYQDPDLKAQTSVSWYAVRRGNGYGVERQTELLIAGDLAQPGATEEWADYEYAYEDGTYSTAAEAQQAAHEAAQRHRASDLRWDGRPPWDQADTASAEAGPAGNGPTTSGATASPGMAPNAEALNAQAAVEFAQAMAERATAGAASVETLRAQLTAGGVEGEALVLTATAIDQFTGLHATFTQLAGVLGGHLVVGDAYAATGGEGGGKRFAQLS